MDGIKERMPVVSICCLTYNHAAFISRCMEGFLIQKTNFPFEILVHDDASTDGTQNIISEFAERYPDSIKPICQKVNQFSQGISPLRQILLPRARGKYIALCEGDDYWTDPLKLQKQFDFMEANPEYGMCYTQCLSYYQNQGKFSREPWGGASQTLTEFLYNNTVPTLTSFFRHDLLDAYLSEIRPSERNWLMGDYPMWLYFAHCSKVKFLKTVTGVYRVLSNSASHASSVQQRVLFIDSTLDLQRFFISKYGISHDFSRLTKGAVVCKLNVYAKAGCFAEFLKEWARTVRAYPALIFDYRPYSYFVYLCSPRLRRKCW